ncbi:MAG: hypothetical protein E7425_08440 [Ruminococcaceae bacterium]|nr:hypothetical protein [Oscillospiraceae bacterium]
MKRMTAFALSMFAALLLAAPAQAKTPKIVDYALYTDIVATIDGHPIRSYNIAGYTAVVAEDLRDYGFWVIWDGAARTLSITRAMRNGELETPETWPDYQPEPLTHRIGERAKPVYETDIVTYAAGDFAEAFNINGETLVFVDSLSPFGSVVWHPEERVISLTLGDPVEIALTPYIENLVQWQQLAGAGSYYETYECKTGTLLVTRYTGTPHGGSTNMLFARKNGGVLSINELLPAYVWGAGYYLAPDGIEIDEPGDRLSFTTPVLEMPDWPESGDVRSLGVCKCVVDLRNGTLLSLEPLSEGLNWQVSLAPDSDSLGETLCVAVERSGSEILGAENVYPNENMMVTMGSSGIAVVHFAAMLTGAGFEKTAYYGAFQALGALGLPDAASSGENVANTAEQRAAAARYVTVTLNGRPVSGNLWWSRGNNHRDLNFTFDEPILLRDGDILQLSVGT